VNKGTANLFRLSLLGTVGAFGALPNDWLDFGALARRCAASTSERRHYDRKTTSIRHAYLTVGDLVDQPAHSVRHFTKNECVR
jgi:hypothetical protein